MVDQLLRKWTLYIYIHIYIYIATTPLFWVVKVGNLKIESCFSTIVKDSSEIHMFSANFPCAYHGMLGRIHTLTNEKLGCIRLYLTTWNGNAITNKNREIETNKHGEHQTIKLGLGIGTKKRDFIIWSPSQAWLENPLIWCDVNHLGLEVNMLTGKFQQTSHYWRTQVTLQCLIWFQIQSTVVLWGQGVHVHNLSDCGSRQWKWWHNQQECGRYKGF